MSAERHAERLAEREQVIHDLLDALRQVEALEQRLGARIEQLEAQLEAVDASFVRHQAQNETDLDQLQRTVDRVGQELDRHQDAHWRSR